MATERTRRVTRPETLEIRLVHEANVGRVTRQFYANDVASSPLTKIPVVESPRPPPIRRYHLLYADRLKSRCGHTGFPWGSQVSRDISEAQIAKETFGRADGT